ncbi:MAG: cytidine/deoxycytidylate deaminase family protein [Chloroflexi bacterium]|nr:cytidine/deoxycytidylate deaminase family protein [Chloroflexota bacterium]
MNRPSWDQYFMDITLDVSRRATCLRAQVGAIIVKDKRILTTGYNGAPKGLPHCLDEGCEVIDGHCVRTLHAEQNAIIQAALHGISLEGGTIYTTHQPCHVCAKMIINAGLVHVIYAGNYPDELAMKYLKTAGVRVDHFDLGDRTPAPPPSVIK